MVKKQDLTGKRFGEWTVLKDDGTRGTANAIMWLCQCDCGNYGHVSTAMLNGGGSKSCGHKKRQNVIEATKRHMRETPGTNLALLKSKTPITNKTGFKNISMTRRNGRERYRVAVMYKRHQYGGLRDTLEDAIKLREELRLKYWPDYEAQSVENVLKNEGK